MLLNSTIIHPVVNGNSSPPPPPPPPGGAEAVLWTQLVNVTAEGSSLRKTAGCDGCEDAGAVSSQTITSGDGFVEFTASETTTIRVAGLSSGNTNTTSADIDFGIKFWTGGEADVRENDLYRADTTYVSGDVFRVAVQSAVIRYSQNGVVFYTSTVAPTFPLLVDTSLLNLNATIGNAVIFRSAAPTPPPPPPGGAEAVLWTQLVNVIAEGSSLRKTAGCDGCEDAGAVSSQTITSGDGFVEFTASETTTIRVAGLSSGNTTTTSADIDFGIKFWPGGEADVRENDLYRADTTYVSGDVFRVAVQSGVIRYSKNGVVFYTSTVAPTFPLLVDTSLYNLDATIGNAVIFRSAAPPPGAGATRTFGNGTAVSIPDSGSGSPYPSSINVAGMPGAISNVVVTLK